MRRVNRQTVSSAIAALHPRPHNTQIRPFSSPSSSSSSSCMAAGAAVALLRSPTTYRCRSSSSSYSSSRHFGPSPPPPRQHLHASSVYRLHYTTTNKTSRFPSLLPSPSRISQFVTNPFLPSSRRTMASASAAGKRIEGKTILITGASSGIGRSTALEFARTSPQNLRLILTARRADALSELAAEITKDVGGGVKVLPVSLDVSDPEAVRNFVPGLPEEWRDIHVLVNNAGLVKGVAKAPEINEEDTDIVFKTNVTGLINMTQAILPIFLKRPNGGQGDIINIGSIAGREAYVGGSIYCASKAAIRSFTESLRKELIATRVRVIEIDPGQVETNFSVVRFYGDKSKADAVYAGCDPLTPEDIAEVIVFTATRKENVVIADTLIFPSHQASATVMHRRS